MIRLRTLLLSPLVHFFALGALIFAAYAAVEDETVALNPDKISLSESEANRLVQNFIATWNRPPTIRELENLMQSWALEEAHVREALILGLDQGDVVIRQRLNQKMKFLAESGAAMLKPDEVMLQTYLDQNPERFTQPARMALEQVVVPRDRDTSKLLALLENGADPATLGSASLLPRSFPMTPAPVIDRTFGDGFHEALATLPVGQWQGPVESGYGLHLVRVIERMDAMLPPLSEIRDRVEAEWLAAETKKLRESFGQALLDRYTVTLPNAEEVLNR
ncbi:peptidylprolyl isomerase [Ruegeria aquimaris]|uniref:Parvulin-like PPIase n=1 Tax=Ruegeria aquimaris TaxID=2984333 RepID=A0ABT3AE94_9RHOB|nr:peptidylprolyl isomerase [Ruegeria sp. XHP0148]MCV2886974.1 peptidylprolyl isomerase [Ruegeria sp. XHP0148]